MVEQKEAPRLVILSHLSVLRAAEQTKRLLSSFFLIVARWNDVKKVRIVQLAYHIIIYRYSSWILPFAISHDFFLTPIWL